MSLNPEKPASDGNTIFKGPFRAFLGLQAAHSVEKLLQIGELDAIMRLCHQVLRGFAHDGASVRPANSLFYYFCVEQHIPQDHLLRSIDQFLDFDQIRQHLRRFIVTQLAPRSIPSS